MNPSKCLFLVGIAVTGLSLSAQAADNKTERLITVTGQGKVSAAPDQAQLRIEVTEDGPRMEAVNQKVRQAMENVLKTLKSQAIPDKDIQTQSYQVTPKLEWKNGRSSRVGYTVSNQVLVTIKDLKKVGSVLSAVTDAGANNISGPDFGFQNPKELERKALTLALEDAKAKAHLLAEAAGATLGPIMTVNESGIQRPGPRPVYTRAMAMVQKATPDVPIASGEETLEAVVAASFSLK